MKENDLRKFLIESERVYNCIVGLDLAIVAGVSIWTPDESCTLEVECRDPILQFKTVFNMLDGRKNTLCSIERLTYFGNKRTVVSLSERIGYFYYSLNEYKKFDVLKLNLNSTRSFFGLKSKTDVLNFCQDMADKKITDNHSDSMVMVEYMRTLLKLPKTSYKVKEKIKI